MKNPIIILINKSFCKAGAGQLNLSKSIDIEQRKRGYLRPSKHRFKFNSNIHPVAVTVGLTSLFQMHFLFSCSQYEYLDYTLCYKIQRHLAQEYITFFLYIYQMGDRIVTHDHSDHSLVTLLLPITDLIFSFSHSFLSTSPYADPHSNNL